MRFLIIGELPSGFESGGVNGCWISYAEARHATAAAQEALDEIYEGDDIPSQRILVVPLHGKAHLNEFEWERPTEGFLRPVL